MFSPTVVRFLNKATTTDQTRALLLKDHKVRERFLSPVSPHLAYPPPDYGCGNAMGSIMGFG